MPFKDDRNSQCPIYRPIEYSSTLSTPFWPWVTINYCCIWNQICPFYGIFLFSRANCHPPILWRIMTSKQGDWQWQWNNKTHQNEEGILTPCNKYVRKSRLSWFEKMRIKVQLRNPGKSAGCENMKVGPRISRGRKQINERQRCIDT